MNKTQRSLLFLVFTVPILTLLYFYTHDRLAIDAVIITVIFSSLLMLAFTSLFLEHYFTRPADVLSASLAILLMLMPVRKSMENLGIWYWLFVLYVFIQALCSIISLLLVDRDKSQQSWQNVWAFRLNKFSTHFGNGKVLFFGLYFLMLIFFISEQTKIEFLLLSVFASAWLIIDPQKLVLSLKNKKDSPKNDVGEIFGVQSKNTFLAKLYDDRVRLKRFDVVEFKYSSDQIQRRGLVIDNYFLEESQWVKVLCSNDIIEYFHDHPSEQVKKDNVLYRLQIEIPAFLDGFVGIVVEGSTIQKIKFEFAHKADISEGALVSVKVRGISILYQVIEGITASETLEHKNETGFIVGEAIQLGVWNNNNTSFQKFGWLPDMNTPIYLSTNIDEPIIEMGEYKIGSIPDTNYPSIINLETAVTHHLAILGVTGSGKSVFARNLIRQIAIHGIKTIIVDLTNEYQDKLRDVNPVEIINDAHKTVIFNSIQTLTAERAKFANQQSQPLIQREEEVIAQTVSESITTFLQSQDTCAMFGLPDLTNTEEIFDYTRYFFKSLFQIAKDHNNFGNRVCVVLEEAHTIVPEWNFSGSASKNSQALVNSISQVALQGRKYNVGFIIIGQRTANISKTVLTQCNTIIAFQQFDKTGSDFLGNYFGNDITGSLPKLEPRQAIATGKALRANVPMIFEVPEIIEP